MNVAVEAAHFETVGNGHIYCSIMPIKYLRIGPRDSKLQVTILLNRGARGSRSEQNRTTIECSLHLMTL